MGMLVLVKDWGAFKNKKLSGKANLSGKPGSVCFPLDSGRFIIHWSCLPRRHVPEWPSYSFDLDLLENLWQDLKMVVYQ